MTSEPNALGIEPSAESVVTVEELAHQLAHQVHINPAEPLPPQDISNVETVTTVREPTATSGEDLAQPEETKLPSPVEETKPPSPAEETKPPPSEEETAESTDPVQESSQPKNDGLRKIPYADPYRFRTGASPRVRPYHCLF
jgi:hypothetical protein